MAERKCRSVQIFKDGAPVAALERQPGEMYKDFASRATAVADKWGGTVFGLVAKEPKREAPKEE